MMWERHSQEVTLGQVSDTMSVYAYLLLLLYNNIDGCWKRKKNVISTSVEI